MPESAMPENFCIIEGRDAVKVCGSKRAAFARRRRHCSACSAPRRMPAQRLHRRLQSPTQLPRSSLPLQQKHATQLPLAATLRLHRRRLLPVATLTAGL